MYQSQWSRWWQGEISKISYVKTTTRIEFIHTSKNDDGMLVLIEKRVKQILNYFLKIENIMMRCCFDRRMSKKNEKTAFRIRNEKWAKRIKC